MRQLDTKVWWSISRILKYATQQYPLLFDEDDDGKRAKERYSKKIKRTIEQEGWVLRNSKMDGKRTKWVVEESAGKYIVNELLRDYFISWSDPSKLENYYKKEDEALNQQAFNIHQQHEERLQEFEKNNPFLYASVLNEFYAQHRSEAETLFGTQIVMDTAEEGHLVTIDYSADNIINNPEIKAKWMEMNDYLNDLFKEKLSQELEEQRDANKKMPEVLEELAVVVFLLKYLLKQREPDVIFDEAQFRADVRERYKKINRIDPTTSVREGYSEIDRKLQDADNYMKKIEMRQEEM